MSFLFIKAFAQILHEFTKLRFYEKGHKKELGSGYKDFKDENEVIWTVNTEGIIQ